MKTILVATDFSKAAHNACVYGIELAKALNAKVILFHAFQVSYPVADNLIMVPAMEIQETTTERLQAELNLISGAKGANVEILCENGPATTTILAVAQDQKASLIIIGMKENVPFLRKIFGSTASPLMRQTTVPLLIVPERKTFSLPKTFALASDLDSETNMNIVKPLNKLAENLQAKVYVVRVVQKGLDEVREQVDTQEALNKVFKNIHHTYEYLKENNVAKAMNQFVKDCNIDILAVIPHIHSFVDRIFIKSNSKEMLTDMRVPLLVLPERTDIPVETYDDKSFPSYQIH